MEWKRSGVGFCRRIPEHCRSPLQKGLSGLPITKIKPDWHSTMGYEEAGHGIGVSRAKSRAECLGEERGPTIGSGAWATASTRATRVAVGTEEGGRGSKNVKVSIEDIDFDDAIPIM